MIIFKLIFIEKLSLNSLFHLLINYFYEVVSDIVNLLEYFSPKVNYIYFKPFKH